MEPANCISTIKLFLWNDPLINHSVSDIFKQISLRHCTNCLDRGWGFNAGGHQGATKRSEKIKKEVEQNYTKKEKINKKIFSKYYNNIYIYHLIFAAQTT